MSTYKKQRNEAAWAQGEDGYYVHWDGLSFEAGADWAMFESELVKGMYEALRSVLASTRNKFNEVEQDICRDALTAYEQARKEVKGE